MARQRSQNAFPDAMLRGAARLGAARGGRVIGHAAVRGVVFLMCWPPHHALGQLVVPRPSPPRGPQKPAKVVGIPQTTNRGRRLAVMLSGRALVESPATQ